MLTVLDEYTREALSVTVATRMGSQEVLEALTPLILQRGAPDYLRSDNGPEFIAEAVQLWFERVGVKPIRIYPGSPLSAMLRIACRAGHGRTATTSGSTEPSGARSLMPSGLQQRVRPRS